MNKNEQDIRKKYNLNFVTEEIIFEGNNLTLLLIFRFVSRFAAGTFGHGGGSVDNPALLALGVQLRVAAWTGMYLVMFSCINACVVNSIQGVGGSFLGLVLADNYVKKSGIQTIFVWLLCLVFIICAAATPGCRLLLAEWTCERWTVDYGFYQQLQYPPNQKYK
jgi:uncharacterized membrane protein YfcA